MYTLSPGSCVICSATVSPDGSWYQSANGTKQAFIILTCQRITSKPFTGDDYTTDKGTLNVYDYPSVTVLI